MSGRYPPLTCADVKRILTQLGFAPRPRGSGSHEQWVKDDEGQRWKVTVDWPKAPFRHDRTASMARQAGVSRRAFYAALDRKA